ncbi:hypothetical protein [Chryseobacterium sp. MP_3.2]|uniref:hypothetical protein n=1 Tax=Chryseobacterium sp. MP_3.2 TaxID=3071712 RepID=UPI002DF851C9|nr:hypothetical protein [Chryseobacterium sp. MP_3.2]
MSRRLTFFFIILGLGIFIIPQQMMNAQSLVECCDHKSAEDNCCKKEKVSTCHTDESNNSTDKNNCGDDCSNCHSCTVNYVLNYYTAPANLMIGAHFFKLELSFDYNDSYYSSDSQNIWQPPKIG